MIGIRHEDKNRWEARVPLVPQDIETLIRDHALEFRIQRSPVRKFPEADYTKAGATVVDDLNGLPRSHRCKGNTARAVPP